MFAESSQGYSNFSHDVHGAGCTTVMIERESRYDCYDRAVTLWSNCYDYPPRFPGVLWWSNVTVERRLKTIELLLLWLLWLPTAIPGCTVMIERDSRRRLKTIELLLLWSNCCDYEPYIPWILVQSLFRVSSDWRGEERAVTCRAEKRFWSSRRILSKFLLYLD